ncbi:hypothetical protein CHUAL_006279 [Chamberlinius hualienensis]
MCQSSLLVIVVLILFSDCTVIHKSPQNATVIESVNHKLDCQFDQKVDCVWLHNETVVENNGKRFKYVDKNVNDCNITITPVKIHDSGTWRCQTKANDISDDHVKSENAHLYIQELQITKQPVDKEEITRGYSILLVCEFNAPVNCSWEKNKTKSSSYVYQTSNGYNTKDCSIHLLNVTKAEHEGNWTCKSVNTPDFKSVSSITTKIQIKDPKYIRVPKSNLKVVIGTDVLLECEFDAPVDCYWLQNGTGDIVGGERIKYNCGNGLSTQICSIIIQAFNYNDIGNWTCLDIQNKNMLSAEAQLAIVESDINSNDRWAIATVILIIIVVPLIVTIILLTHDKKKKKIEVATNGKTESNPMIDQNSPTNENTTNPMKFD